MPNLGFRTIMNQDGKEEESQTWALWSVDVSQDDQIVAVGAEESFIKVSNTCAYFRCTHWINSCIQAKISVLVKKKSKNHIR